MSLTSKYTLSLALSALLAVPTVAAPAQDGRPAEVQVQEVVTQKVPVTARAANDVIRFLNEAGADVGIRSMVGYVRDNSLIVRGTPEGVRRLVAAVRLLDVPVQEAAGGQAEVTLRPAYAKPEAIRDFLMTLPGAGHATLRDGRLVLEGRREWIDQVLPAAVRVELNALKGEAVRPKAAPSARIELIVPKDFKLNVTGGNIVLDANGSVQVDRGTATVEGAGGFRLEIANARISVLRATKDGPARLIVEPAEP